MDKAIAILAIIGAAELTFFVADAAFAIHLALLNQDAPMCARLHVAYVHALFAK
jgi:hypothetical protein